MIFIGILSGKKWQALSRLASRRRYVYTLLAGMNISSWTFIPSPGALSWLRLVRATVLSIRRRSANVWLSWRQKDFLRSICPHSDWTGDLWLCRQTINRTSHPQRWCLSFVISSVWIICGLIAHYVFDNNCFHHFIRFSYKADVPSNLRCSH